MQTDWLKDVQRIELEMLEFLAAFCDTHNLRYYLIGGTLLGAVRHKGFIPWDDDVDVVMPRADYDRFKALCKAELPNAYFLQTPEDSPRYPMEITKVRKKGTVYLTKLHQRFNTENPGIWIDIFPLDNVPHQRSFFQDFYGKLYQHVVKKILFRYSEDPAVFTAIGRLQYRLVHLLPWKCYIALRKALLQHYNGRDCDYYANYGSQYGYIKQTMPKSAYDPPVKLEFEGKLFSAPRDYDFILRRIFGDYMQLPPEEKRRMHTPLEVMIDPKEGFRKL